MGLFGKSKEKSNMATLPVNMASPIGNSNMAPPVVKQEVNSIQKLETPPMPGDGLISLNQIKNEVINSELKENRRMDESKVDNDKLDFTNDSLFDFSSMDTENEIPTLNQSQNLFNEDKETAVIDTNLKKQNQLNFIKSGFGNKNIEENFYITTSQFKSMLGILEQVKQRIKFSTETHLRLLDLKSEEDVEFENLRKDFEFLENKLYEIDNLIFEK